MYFKKFIINFPVVILYLGIFVSKIFAYDANVHPLINTAAIQSSNNFLNTISNLGFEHGVDDIINGALLSQWFVDGAILEDETHCRSKFHFHDPTRTFDEAGLSNVLIDTYCFDFRHRSSLVWAQDDDNQWSWQMARENYYNALTLPNNREENFANTFRALGQVMHLIADSSVPLHTRNDIHIFPQTIPILEITLGRATYETWTGQNAPGLNYNALAIDYSIVDSSLVPGLVPITNFWDTMPLAGYITNPTGISEYSNYNFLSKDTIFKDYTYPQQLDNFFLESVIAEDGTTDYRVYFNGMTSDGIPIQYLASTGYLWSELSDQFPYDLDDGRFNLDDNCYEEYASILIPKAVGYSAGLLDYFFRGDIEITLPDTGVYALTNDSGTGFISITLVAKNVTPDAEEMTDGSIELVVKYKLALEDPFRDYPEDYPFQVEEEFSYIVVPDANNTRSIPRDTTVELVFDLSQNPLPLYAIDVYLQVVYKGRLGNEDNAVAVGFKDISEPTPIDLFSNTDKICLNNAWYNAGSPEAIAVVDVNGDGRAYGQNEWDVYPHDQKDIYIKFSRIDIPQYASPTVYDSYISYLTAGNLSRKPYILSDYGSYDKFNYSFYASWERKDPDDWWTHLGTQEIYYGYAIKNQTDYVKDAVLCDGAPSCYIWFYPNFYTIRDIDMWWGGGLIYFNAPYPEGSACSYDLL